MGSKGSKSNSNFSESNSESISNSAEFKEELEKMECKPENSNTKILRVWIVKKSISLSDEHVSKDSFMLDLFHKNNKNTGFGEPKINIFNIKNEYHTRFKHWAIILELSNKTYVNIQFGRNGFKLIEFNKEKIEGYTVLRAILDTWGEKTHPVSFCYLGSANYYYETLKNYLRNRKDNEKKNFDKNERPFYNLTFKNCQHFACDIERELFNGIQTWHKFNYYLDDFYRQFFPEINLNKLKSTYAEILRLVNLHIFNYNNALIEATKKPSNDQYNIHEKLCEILKEENFNKFKNYI